MFYCGIYTLCSLCLFNNWREIGSIDMVLLSLLSILLAVFLGPFLFLVSLLAAAAFIGRSPFAGRSLAPCAAATSRFVLVIPAHNEAEVIQRTLTSLNGLDYPRQGFEILVIADNCTDETAALARLGGARVVERFNEKRRGKGVALEEILARLEADGGVHDAVVILDADTIADAGLLREFDAALASGADWMQAYYNGSNPEESWRTRLMAIALALFNGTWLKGWQGLGLSVPLRGNGMCFSRRGLARHPWASHGLAEDLEFAWSLRLAGERAHFVPGARVYGELVARDPKAAASQRLRWEHGRRAVRRAVATKLLRAPLPFWPKVLYTLDLLMPPIGPLAAATVASGLLSIGLSLALGHEVWGIGPGFWASALVGLGGYLVSPIVLLGLPPRFYLSLKDAPRYLLWKAALFFDKRPGAWVRTRRGV